MGNCKGYGSQFVCIVVWCVCVCVCVAALAARYLVYMSTVRRYTISSRHELCRLYSENALFEKYDAICLPRCIQLFLDIKH